MKILGVACYRFGRASRKFRKIQASRQGRSAKKNRLVNNFIERQFKFHRLLLMPFRAQRAMLTSWQANPKKRPLYCSTGFQRASNPFQTRWSYTIRGYDCQFRRAPVITCPPLNTTPLKSPALHPSLLLRQDHEAGGVKSIVSKLGR